MQGTSSQIFDCQFSDKIAVEDLHNMRRMLVPEIPQNSNVGDCSGIRTRDQSYSSADTIPTSFDHMFPEGKVVRIDTTYAIFFSVLFCQCIKLRDTSHQETRTYHLLAKFHSIADNLYWIFWYWKSQSSFLVRY